MAATTLAARLARPRRDSDFSSRAEAVKAAREAVWGTVPFSQRECIRFGRAGDGSQLLGLYVTANVNGRLVLIDFDNYGRTHAVQAVD